MYRINRLASTTTTTSSLLFKKKGQGLLVGGTRFFLLHTSPPTTTTAMAVAPKRITARFLSSDNITYSGGQATEGQGGFYGSGGARVLDIDMAEDDLRKGMLGLATDVENIRAVMTELDILESELEKEEPSAASKRSIELRAQIKKLMTHPDVTECLSRLEVKGEPVWGLSTEERELIIQAREKANEC